MTEKELLEKLKDSAQKEEVPQGLKPDEIRKKLKKSQKKNYRRYGKTIAAGIVLFLCVTGGLGAFWLQDVNKRQIAGEPVDAAVDLQDEAQETIKKDTAADNAEESGCTKTDAGDQYVVAKNYGEIYDAISSSENLSKDFIEDASIDSVSQSFKGSGVQSEMATNTEEETSHSTTNLQTEGVDESDIVKTDGSYIYTVSNQCVEITDIREGALKEAGRIEIEATEATDSILEMYVEGSMLNLIVQKEQANLQKDAKSGVTESKQELYYIDSDTVTELLTYDISDPQMPKLIGSVKQDGSYHTSRKIGDIIYLFTDKNVVLPAKDKDDAVKEKNVASWIPSVNEKAVAADSIYISDAGTQGLVISSTNVKKPDRIVDNTVILNNNVDIYVSATAVYLYENNYFAEHANTQLAKFRLKDGKINAVGAVRAKGSVLDTFAINENQGKLRLLTTSDPMPNGKSANNLYLFDQNLKLTGKIEGMAAGEEIYAARYLGDMAYFVTYRNTDPLFAVDLSDEQKPKVIGELKISGFSEYLHFWGKDKLVGIGYETNPDTGEHLGIKITMFDLSDPENLKEISSTVLKDVNDSRALYEYKCVLADADKNLLGFTTESYGNKNTMSYVLFSWKDQKFCNLMTESLDDALDQSCYRGVYAGDVFYLVSSKEICSYDRGNDYKLIKKLSF